MTGRLTPRLASRPLDVVVRRLRALSALSEAEQDLLRTLGERRERHSAGEELVAEGSLAGRARFILAGWACRQRVLPDGRRQIFSFLLPGDSIGLHRRVAPELSSLAALTALETIDADPALEAAQSGRAPGLTRAFSAIEPFEQGLLLDHMVRLGRQTAYERVAHFLLELQRRLEIVGLGDTQRFPLPLTQEIMADALGLSIVHVNRTLQQMRRERLIELRSGVAILLQREQLANIADYRLPPQAAVAAPAVKRSGLEDASA
ncbi:MAG: transcriptional regulator, Crp/Fnr family [Phenylobacterium sp.]|nr:transcriptional regulator, Crp/Fnr family [Phenylobacterium sp.]